MPTDTLTLMGFGVAAIVVVWLVFSVVKKVVGFLLLIALAVGLWLLWSNPTMLQSVLQAVGVGGRFGF